MCLAHHLILIYSQGFLLSYIATLDLHKSHYIFYSETVSYLLLIFSTKHFTQLINRTTFLEILTLQDSIADKAEDIAISATLKKLTGYERIKKDFNLFCKKNITTFLHVQKVIKEFDSLLESSFGGLEAQKVKKMIEEVSFMEHEVDLLQSALLKKLYRIGEKLDHTTFTLWLTIIIEIAAISNLSEKLANRIRMILEIS